MSATNEYNKGKPIDITKINEEEKSIAIIEWSEGNESLRSAIEECMKNAIMTHASCKGHQITARPYLSMIADGENVGKIINIMNRICQMNNVVVSLSYSDYNRFNGKRKTLLNIYGNMLNRNNVFKAIAEAANNEIKYEDLSEDAKALWDFHMSMRKHGFGIDHNLIFTKGFFGKRIDIDNAFNHLTLNDILEKNGFTLGKGLNIQYYKNGNPKKILEPVIEKVSILGDRKDNEFDSIYKEEKSNDFREKLKAEKNETNNKDSFINENKKMQETQVVKDEQTGEEHD